MDDVNSPIEESQGEGDEEAARRHERAAKEFAESGKVEPGAHEAAPHATKDDAATQAPADSDKSQSKGDDSLISDKRTAGDMR